MAYRVVLTEKAERDVELVLRWFRDQQVTAAGGRWLAQLLRKLNALEANPERCPLVVESDELAEEIREMLLGRNQFKYRVIFRINGRVVQILRVWHSSRDAITAAEL